MCNTSVWVLDVNTQRCTVSSTGVVTRQHSNSVHAEHRLTCIVVVDVFICPISVSNRRSVIERAGQIRLVFDKNVSFDLHMCYKEYRGTGTSLCDTVPKLWTWKISPL